MVEKITQAILDVLPDAQVKVQDPHNDGQHFTADVASASFEGMSLVKQHQIVMNALKAHFDTDMVHALQLKTRVLK